MNILDIKGSSKLAVIWLHGYGANAWDLLDLAELCDPDLHYSHYFPNAPIDLYGMGERGPRAWYQLDLSEIMNRGPSSEGLKLSTRKHLELEEALGCVDLIVDEIGVAVEDLVIGGFSQGAVLSLYWMLQRSKKPRGLIHLSGGPLDESYLVSRLAEHSGQNFFQSHGMGDNVLNFAEAERLRSHFKKAGFKGRWIPFKGAHTVPQEVVVGLGEILSEWRNN